MKKILFFCTILAFSVTLAAQTVGDSVRFIGTVLDGKTAEPLPFVTIHVKDSLDKGWGGTTDIDGRFRIDMLAGEYFVEVRFLGYLPYSERLTIDGRPADLVLTPVNPDNLEEIIIVYPHFPLLIPGPDTPVQKMEIDGVPVRVR